MTSQVSPGHKGMARGIHMECGWFNAKDHRVRGENWLCTPTTYAPVWKCKYRHSRQRRTDHERERSSHSVISLCNHSFIPSFHKHLLFILCGRLYIRDVIVNET